MPFVSEFASVFLLCLPHRPFRAVVFRGLGGFIPPLLTVVVILWMFGTVDQYVLGPVELGTTKLISKSLEQYLLHPAEGDNLQFTATIKGKAYDLQRSGPEFYIEVDGTPYYLTSDNSFVSAEKYLPVRRHDGFEKAKTYTGPEVCYRFTEL